ncbi:MAG: hypothetical protein AAB478_02275 [Patescibacteria group bacterium]
MDESAARPEEQIDGRTVSGPKHPHDSHGHFIHKFPTPPKPGSQPSLTEKLFPTHVSVDHKVTQDALLDVHIGNPLRRITQLLEEIKRQKAFSFTLKGSLGIMGVALALSVFGFFGSSKVLCDKGTQTLSGTIKSLSVMDRPAQIPVLSTVINSANYLLFHKGWPTGTKRYVLVDLKDASTIGLQASESDLNSFLNQVVYITGGYDSCSRVLKVTQPHAIEELH